MIRRTIFIALSLILFASLLPVFGEGAVCFPKSVPTIYIEPIQIINLTLTPGKNFTVEIKLRDGINLYGVEIKVTWKNALLEYLSGTVLVGQSNGVLNPPTQIIKNGVYLDQWGNKFYWLVATSTPPATGWSGNGTIVKIQFKVKDDGWCLIDVYGTDLVNKNAQRVSHNVEDGYFCNLEFQGDVDGDGKVGLSDLVLLGKAYGSRPGDPNWDSRCDFDNDGVVALSDWVILTKNYGRTKV